MSEKDISKGGEGLSAYEPDPVPNEGPSMHDLVYDDFLSSAHYKTNNLACLGVMGDLEDRRKFGLDKYGTLLQAHNGRNALIDAYQEVQDLLVYMKQAMVENPTLELELQNSYTDMMRVAVKFRYLINLRG